MEVTGTARGGHGPQGTRVTFCGEMVIYPVMIASQDELAAVLGAVPSPLSFSPLLFLPPPSSSGLCSLC